MAEAKGGERKIPGPWKFAQHKSRRPGGVTMKAFTRQVRDTYNKMLCQVGPRNDVNRNAPPAK